MILTLLLNKAVISVCLEISVTKMFYLFNL